MDTCPVCGVPCLGGICAGCLEEMSGVEASVIKKFIHALASRENKIPNKYVEQEEELEYQDG